MADLRKRPIGIFDSGLGGLTVLKEVEKILPNEDIVYFGDTARVPYGSKSKSTVVKFSIENVLFLLEKQVKFIVVACNTSTSLALEYLKRNFNVPIVGVIESGAEKAISKTKTKKIAIIGTSSTIASGKYQKVVAKKDKTVKVYAKACPLFVSLVEEGLIKGKITESVVDMYLKKLPKDVDTLVLGCTHYPVLKNVIAKYLKKVYLVDSANTVAAKVCKELNLRNLLNPKKTKGKVKFFVSDKPKEFMKLAKIFLKRKINQPKLVTI